MAAHTVTEPASQLPIAVSYRHSRSGEIPRL